MGHEMWLWDCDSVDESNLESRTFFWCCFYAIQGHVAVRFEYVDEILTEYYHTVSSCIYSFSILVSKF